MGVEVGADFDRKSIHVDSQVIEGMAAMAGEGVAMLTPLFWRNELENGRLVQPFERVCADSSFWLVYLEHKHGAPKVRAFREWLIDEIANDPAKRPFP